MIKSKSSLNRGIEIDLTGPQGNALYLLGCAGHFADQIGLDKEALLIEMQAGDYENLLQVFEKYFGAVVTLLR